MVIQKYISENKASLVQLNTSTHTVLHLNLEPAHSQNMQPSKHSYKTVRMCGEILGGSYGWYYYYYYRNTRDCTALLMIVSNVTWKTTTASSTSWLKSRKIQLILHELSLGLWDLHIKAEAAVRRAPCTHPASLEMSKIHKRQSLNQQMSSCRFFFFFPVLCIRAFYLVLMKTPSP